MALVDSRLMPGFRFHPTDEELVMYYLKRKVMGKMTHCAEIISELDIYKYEPSDLPDKACLKSRDLNWYFFCPRRGNKYANGVRANRATEFGYWKATGNDRTVSHNNHTVGKIKTLIFHRGKPPKGNRTDWVIHEYRLDDSTLAAVGVMQDLYVLCKVFHKSGFGPKNGEQYGAPFVEEEWDDDDIKIQCVPASSPPAVKCCDTKNAAGLCDHNVNGNTCAAVSLEVVMCGERVKQQAEVSSDLNLEPRYDDELDGMLATFVEDLAPTKILPHSADGNSDELEIYNQLDDLSDWVELHQGGYLPGSIDSNFFLELDDLD
ncbi:hypothetical protein Dimus_012015 [Dionaea muscipula]